MSMGMAPWRLAAGPVWVDFEPWSGWLRGIRTQERLLVLALYGAVRGADWSTLEPRVRVVLRDVRKHSFQIEWVMAFAEAGISLHCSARGTEDGSITAEWKGRCHGGYSSMRTGLCVLHPLDQAGSPVTVTHVDGSLERGRLPELIAPHQPFQDIAGIAVDGVVEIGLEGEVFEMEDQRNWSDPSFKTYCRPHSWPSPYPVPDEFCHRVTIRPLAGAPVPPVRVWEGAIPPIGDEVDPGSLAPCRPALILTNPGQGGPPAGPGGAAYWEPGSPAGPARWTAVTHPSHAEEARAARPEAGLLLASRGGFVHLNRMDPRPPCDGVLFSLCPQIHAADDRSIIETLWTIPDLVRSARALCPGGKVMIGPFQFADLPGLAAPRLHCSLAGRAWRAGSILMAAAAGADVLFPWSEVERRSYRMDEADLLRRMEGTPVRLEARPLWDQVMRFQAGQAETWINLSPLPQQGPDGLLGPWEVLES